MQAAVRIAALIIFGFSSCISIAAQQTQTEQTQTQPPSQQKQKEIDPAKKADIKKMLKLSGAGNMGRQVLNQLISMQRQQYPNVPKEFWDKFMAEADMEELIDATIPSYDRHFTHDDIKELIKFFESPIGKKMVATQPKVMQESMMAGQRWGMKMASRMAQRMKDEGYVP